MILFNIKESISDELIKLAWDTFFVSRGRGVSFDYHFPWAKTDSNVWSIEAQHNGKVIAGLVVREQKLLLDSGTEIVGCIGLVCVHPDYRGKGIANDLFKRVIRSARNNKYVALTLWTNQHHIYQSKGFEVYDQSVYGSVTFLENDNSDCQYTIQKLPIGIGLPPFAKSGNQYVTNNAQISILWDDVGGVIVDWNGDDESIICLIKSIFPQSFRINSRMGCSIIKALQKEKCNININKTNLQMWLQLNESVIISELDALGRFGVLNRI